MPRHRIPAVFIRGGSSKGVFFHARDLPGDRETRDRIFLSVLGSPDPYRRQLNGMGGGVSSVSKAVIIAPSAREDADVDYTFAQVSVDRPEVDYSATCGNLSSAVGPFAVDEGLVRAEGGEALVRVYNTNTDKVYHARFPVTGGQAVEVGDFAIPGVAGTGARVTLDYVDPGGAATGELLPTGNAHDTLEVDGLGAVEVSLVDATSAVVYVVAQDVGCTATEHPDALDADKGLMAKLEAIRRAAAVAMGMAARPQDAPPSAPRVAMVAPPAAFQAIDGSVYGPDTHDLSIRIISMERCHKAVMLTGAMCTGVAAGIEGTIPHALAHAGAKPLRLGNPSGVLPVQGEVERPEGAWHAKSATVYRTQRRLMEGHVLVPADTAALSEAAE
jgi:2-methylaconitate cis-trans-isomerase PrpF